MTYLLLLAVARVLEVRSLVCLGAMPLSPPPIAHKHQLKRKQIC